MPRHTEGAVEMGGYGDGTGVSGMRAASSLVSLSALCLVLVLVPTGAPLTGVDGDAGPDVWIFPSELAPAGEDWLYLRDDEPLLTGQRVVELIAVGDLMLGRGVSDRIDPLGAVAPWLQAADLALGNLECVIAEGGTPRPGPYRLRAPVSTAATLREAGFDVLGLANNHALDLGPAGLAEMATRLQAADMDIVGAGVDAEVAAQALIREINGVRLAFLAFNAVPDPQDRPGEFGWRPAVWDRERAMAAIRRARTGADAVVVSIHWGYEYDLRPDPVQREMARALVEAGADLILGHHPHVVQGTHADVEGSRGRFVAYSLGNLLFDQQQGETKQGLALRAFLDQQGLRAVQALPVWSGPRPRWMDSSEAGSLLARVQPPPQRVGFSCATPVTPADELCRPTEVAQMPASGSFEVGAIDLTGDGVLEQVRRIEEQVSVYQGGVHVWRGLPEWRVVDLALGDPNDDGRAEMLLALWKPDGAGVPRSHPFIIGFREGMVRILWGGSAVVDPIHEVELGDVDGDGKEELVVLEGRDGAAVLSVWRWHGWGFSLLWRSAPGRYRDLVLEPAGAGEPLVVTAAIDP
jgi:hypothetical protein